MTNEIQPENIISMDDVKALFGERIAQLMLDSLVGQNSINSQAKLIQQLTANEARLVKNIQALESELAEIKTATKSTLSPALAELAAQADGIIEATQ